MIGLGVIYGFAAIDLVIIIGAIVRTYMTGLEASFHFCTLFQVLRIVNFGRINIHINREGTAKYLYMFCCPVGLKRGIGEVLGTVGTIGNIIQVRSKFSSG